MKRMIQMPKFEILPLDWALSDKIGVKTHTAKTPWGSYEFCTGWKNAETSLHIRLSDIETTWHDNPKLAQAAANVHHAAQVLSQIAGVTLIDDEAQSVADAVTSELDRPFCGFHWETQNAMAAAVQAAFAALVVTGLDDPKGGA
jgi:hypothetical protein